jgi:hypothetical protein
MAGLAYLFLRPSVSCQRLLNRFTWYKSSVINSNKELDFHPYWSSAVTVYINLNFSVYCSFFYCVVIFTKRKYPD